MALSGQTTVTTAGTEVPLSTTQAAKGGAVIIKALPGNTGVMYIGNDGAGAVSSASGFPLMSGEYVILELEKISSLSSIWVDASVNGEKVAWILTEVGAIA